MYAVPLTPVNNVAFPLTQAPLSSGIDPSTLQENFTQKDVNMSVITRNLDVISQEGISTDNSLGGTTRPLSASVMLSASDASPSSRATQPRS